MIGRGKSTSSWLQMLASLSIGQVISRMVMVMISNKHQDGDGGDHNNSDIDHDHDLDLLLINSDFREDKKSKRHMAILKLE